MAPYNIGVDQFGDFQTPVALAKQVCRLLADRGLSPASVVEPTCGIGNFLLTALDCFPMAISTLGVEINGRYVDRLKASLQTLPGAEKVRVIRGSCFVMDWDALLADIPEPILVIGNPPWVTNAKLGAVGSTNVPEKSNFQKQNGLDAITGKSNFDISEWMIVKLLELLNGRTAVVAMLCKTTVARRVLTHVWRKAIRVADAEIHHIDAATLFDAAVEACLLVCSLTHSGYNRDCRVYRKLADDQPATVIGYHDGQLIANVAAYDRWRHLQGQEIYKWRSGVKHDCSKVMELRKEARGYRNGLGELVHLEDEYLYPMLKSSELATGKATKPSRWMLVTQRAVGDSTNAISVRAPKTWDYLKRYSEALDRRASSIYRDRPRFSIFGVGDYSFLPWKVAISGFYKNLQFIVVGNYAKKPVVLDDTAYFIACQTEQEARYIASLLDSDTAREFFSAFIFWDSKRPITAEVLRRLDLMALARELRTEETMLQLLEHRNADGYSDQQDLFAVRATS